MPVSREKLNQYLNEFLSAQAVKDYCPNGLQIEGAAEVQTLVTGVTASQALIDAAIEKQADAILVHHGYFWRGEPENIVGYKKRRIAALLANDISLFAFHLPLDLHPELGNNAQLGKQLGFTNWQDMAQENPNVIGLRGELEEPKSGEEFAELLQQRLGFAPVHVPADRAIKTVAWCTGGAQNYIDAAALQKVDAYITGEISEPTVHSAQEQGIHFYAAGHHATERYGVKALGEHLAQHFGINHQFIDIPIPA